MIKENINQPFLQTVPFLLVWLSSILVYRGAIRKIWPHTVDDSTTFRYVHNLAETALSNSGSVAGYQPQAYTFEPQHYFLWVLTKPEKVHA